MFHIESAFEFYKMYYAIDIYINLQILLLYSWPIYFSNRSVTLTINACCFMKRYVVVKHMTAKKVYAIHNEKHCDFDTLRIRRMENV